MPHDDAGSPERVEEAFLDRYRDAFAGIALGAAAVARFRRLVYAFFRAFGRTLPWRATCDPYAILVSEIMLQQTQVRRVVEKYQPFLTAFPDFDALARARLADVLARWEGLGYNRRAQALHAAAREVITIHAGTLPDSIDALVALPGVGRATAAAVCAYAGNMPVVYIETNIRTVFIHFFFRDRQGISDAELLPLVEKTLDRRRPRRWYSALMDLGVAVKRIYGNAARRSAHYVRQSPFEGSRRQARGLILKALIGSPALAPAEIARRTGRPLVVVEALVTTLAREGLLHRRGRRYAIP